MPIKKSPKNKNPTKKTPAKKSEVKEKLSASSLVLAALNKAFGEEAVIRMRDARPREVVSTGQTVVDYGVLGIGGIPKGYFIEIYGKEKAGKTSLILSMIASCQRNNIVAIVIDPKLSAADDIERAERIGVNLDDVIMVPLTTSERALAIVTNAISTAKANNFDVMIFWDDMSLAKTDVSGVANKSRVMWEFCRSLGGVCYKTGTSVIIANHLISKIGSFFGPSETTTGGGGSRALSRVRIKLSNMGKWDVRGKRIGNKVKIKTEANAFFAPFREGVLYLNYIDGYNNKLSVLEEGVLRKLVVKGRGLYKYGDISSKDCNDFSDDVLLDLSRRIWPESFGLDPNIEDEEIIDGDISDIEEIYIDG